MAKFLILKSTNGEFYFNLVAGNGEVVLTSERYSNKAACENGIASVKENAKERSRFVRRTVFNAKHSFNLTAENGQVIGTSEMYSSEQAAEQGIEAVIRSASEAEIPAG